MRHKKIIKISIFGIILNVVLVAVKSMIGLVTGSIAMVIDALNNLSDVLSAVITIVGTKLANKKPDKEHPYGHGRIEYLASIIIAILVLLAGLGALNESMNKIIHLTQANYSVISLILIGIFVKLFFGTYVKKQGKELNSSSLIATGVDAIGDSLIATSTFIGGILSYIWNISIEGYIGIIISLMIIRTAMGILKTTLNQIIGVRADSDTTKKLKHLISSYDDVLGVYDLTLHNYGPNNIIGTVHIEVKDDMKAKDIHKLTRNIIIDIYKKLGITLTIGIYASSETKYNYIKEYLNEILKGYKEVLQLHAFYVDEEKNIVSFDLVFDFEEHNPNKIIEEIKNKLKEKYPKYEYIIILDKDYSD